MTVTIRPSRAVGAVAAPSSKSMAHRMLICAGLSSGTSQIGGIDLNEDILATIACLRALGADCSVSGDTVTVRGVDMKRAKAMDILSCHESGNRRHSEHIPKDIRPSLSFRRRNCRFRFGDIALRRE